MLEFSDYPKELVTNLLHHVEDISDDDVWEQVYITSSADNMADISNVYLELLFNKAEEYFNKLNIECEFYVHNIGSSFELIDSKLLETGEQ